MNKKLKYGLIIGGSVLIVGAMFLRGNSSGGQDIRTNPNVLDARVRMNQEAFRFRSIQAESNANIVINRDKVSGASRIAALQALGGMIAGGQELSARLQESYAGIVNARIYSDTTKYIEAQRASVQKKIAKYGMKSSDYKTTLGFASSALQSAPAIISAFS